jgi:CxxC-x17-CxxC domain-containing protein
MLFNWVVLTRSTCEKRQQKADDMTVKVSQAPQENKLGGTQVYEYNDKILICIDCEQEFIFTAGEQQFFADKALRNEPKRCKQCKQKKNDRIAANMQLYGQPFQRERVEVSVKCALCAIETTVPFRPTQGRPVYCRDCFLRMRASTAHAHYPLP